MTPATSATTLLVEDPSSLKNLDHLVGMARTMMDHMLHNPVALARFTRTAFFGVSTRFLDDGKGMVNTFDFSQHQAHPFSLSLVSHYDGAQEWTGKLNKSNLLGKSIGNRIYNSDSTEGGNSKPQSLVDSPWEIRVMSFDSSLLPTLSKYLQQVTDWSKELSEILKSPSFTEAAKIEKSRRNRARLKENRTDDLSFDHLGRFNPI